MKFFKQSIFCNFYSSAIIRLFLLFLDISLGNNLNKNAYIDKLII